MSYLVQRCACSHLTVDLCAGPRQVTIRQCGVGRNFTVCRWFDFIPYPVMLPAAIFEAAHFYQCQETSLTCCSCLSSSSSSLILFCCLVIFESLSFSFTRSFLIMLLCCSCCLDSFSPMTRHVMIRHQHHSTLYLSHKKILSSYMCECLSS